MSDDYDILIEMEANQFAIELLMPTRMFLQSIHDMFPGGIMDIDADPRIDKLAELYQVSRQLCLIRIGQLTKVSPGFAPFKTGKGEK